ncbi:MAG: hypothetical protein ABEI96_06525 [Haloarculaceae archaeon]
MGLNLRTVLAVAAVALLGVALLALQAGNIKLAGIAFFSVSLLIYARETRT